jgi:hypothetical protein
MGAEAMTLDEPEAIAPAEVACLSPSIAKILLARSPMHAWDAHRLGGNHKDEPTEGQTRGRILDKLLFGVGPEIDVLPFADYRSKSAQAERDTSEAMGRMPVLACKIAAYREAVAGWAERLNAAGVFLTGQSQVGLHWDEDGTPCKGYLDHLIIGANSATIYDLKTCADASPSACAKAIAQHAYEVQHAAYVAGVEANYPHLVGRVRMAFLFCEVERPWGVNVVELAGTLKLVGNRKWSHAVRVWGECLRSGAFPGYSGVTRIEAKNWQLDESLDLETEATRDGDGDGE